MDNVEIQSQVTIWENEEQDKEWMTQEKMMNRHWLDIDPMSSLNAMNIVSWNQEFDIKLLVKLKLHSQGFKFDINFQKNLENFCRMKYRIEKQQETVVIKAN